MEAREQSFSKLLAIEGNQWHYHVPKYQREYTWRRPNWEQLLTDMEEDPTSHYMGSIICVDEDKAHNPDDELIYEVVDGQQRLTTLSLLLMAIYQKLTAISKANLSGGEGVSGELEVLRHSISSKLLRKLRADTTIKPSLIIRDGEARYVARVKPSEQDGNYADYLYTLREVGLLSTPTKPPKYKYGLIYKAFIYFRDNTPSSEAELVQFLDQINKLEFIHISVSQQSKAYVLFETLNYRGVPLSAIDIIKNKMLSTLEARHSLDIDSSFERWQGILTKLPSDNDQNRFLRQYYNAFQVDSRIKIEKIQRATKSGLIKIYEELIQRRDAKWLFSDLIEKANIYNEFIEPSSLDDEEEAALLDLQRVGAAPSYTFLLWLKSLDKANWESENLFREVAKFFEKYFVRRNITDTPPTRDLDQIMIDLVSLCHGTIGEGLKLSLDLIGNALLESKRPPASIHTFREKLGGDVYSDNRDMTRYLLARLDNISHSREYAPDLWQRTEKDDYVWTIEHVLPEGENIPQDWIDMIGGGDAKRAKELQRDHVHKFGNLTLTGYNSSLSNSSFYVKQHKNVMTVLGTKISTGYENGLAINNREFELDGRKVSLSNIDKWTVEAIQARTSQLINDLVSLYSFER